MPKVLTRYHLARPRHLDRAGSRPIRRYEHHAPGDLIHVDIKKPGTIPNGGGHRVLAASPGLLHLWRDTLAAVGFSHERTRPYRPHTNGKGERFNRTLLEEWAYARPYTSETDRRVAPLARGGRSDSHVRV